MTNSVGRPLKFKSVKDLQEKTDEYFYLCDPHSEEYDYVDKEGDVVSRNRITEQKPYTITGLALHLDTDRQTLLNYQEKEEYFDTIKRAKVKIESFVEDYLFSGKNQTGAIFNLVNNYGWENKSRTDLSNNGKDFPASIVQITGMQIVKDEPKENANPIQNKKRKAN